MRFSSHSSAAIQVAPAPTTAPASGGVSASAAAPFAPPEALTDADLEAIFAIGSQLMFIREARWAAKAVIREVPAVKALALELLIGVSRGSLTRAQAAARVIASGLVLPIIAAAAKAYAGTAAVVEQLAPLLRKVGFTDGDIAGAWEHGEGVFHLNRGQESNRAYLQPPLPSRRPPPPRPMRTPR